MRYAPAAMQLSLCDAGAMRPHVPPLCGFESTTIGCWLGVVLAWQTYLPYRTTPHGSSWLVRLLGLAWLGLAWLGLACRPLLPSFCVCANYAPAAMQLSLCDAGAMHPHAPPLCGFDSNIVGCWLGMVLAWQTYLPTAPRRTGYATRARCALMRRRYAALSQLV